MCLAAHRVIKHKTFSPLEQCKQSDTKFPLPPLLRLSLLARCTKQFAVAQMHNTMILEYIFWLLHPPFLSLLHPVAWLPWALKSRRAQGSFPRHYSWLWELGSDEQKHRAREQTAPFLSLWEVQPLPSRCKGQWAGKKQISSKAQLFP